jgi:hypothetical protein
MSNALDIAVCELLSDEQKTALLNSFATTWQEEKDYAKLSRLYSLLSNEVNGQGDEDGSESESCQETRENSFVLWCAVHASSPETIWITNKSMVDARIGNKFNVSQLYPVIKEIFAKLGLTEVELDQVKFGSPTASSTKSFYSRASASLISYGKRNGWWRKSDGLGKGWWEKQYGSNLLDFPAVN